MVRGMTRTRLRTSLFAVLIALVVCVGLIPGAVAAQAQVQDAQTGGTVVVEEGETVDNLEAFAGTVVVDGTVTGDVDAVAGSIRINGDVSGNVEATGGSVTIAGTVDGDVEAATGSLEVAEGATIGGSLSGGAGSVAIDGTIEGDATIGADTIRLGEDAAIAGDLRYGGDLEGNTDAVAGTIQQDSSLGPSGDFAPSIPFGSWLVAGYTLVLNLVLGAVLLGLFPQFSDGVADRVGRTPLRSGLAGLGVLIGVPILLVALAITIVGIPLSIVGAFAFAFVVWIGVVYGWFAVAARALSAAGVESRWLALVVGVVAGALVARIPWIGGLLSLLVLLLGLGAFAYGLYSHRKAVGGGRQEPQRGVAEGPAAD
ncbi:bactofilin family protein [Halopiger thermotolerans]